MNDSMIELSVIIPVYNVEDYLERCIDSILNQSYSVGEIICVNDGSTDHSGEILNRLALGNAKIKVIHKKNGGHVSARKAGLAIAKGKYIAFVDSDDWVEPCMYEMLMRQMLCHDAELVTSGLIRDYGHGSVVENEMIPRGVYESDRLLTEVKMKMIDTHVFYRSNINVHLTNKIYKRDLIIKHLSCVDERITVGEDAACIYPCILDAKKIVVTGMNFYHYCIHNSSVMGRICEDEYQRLVILFTYLKCIFEQYSAVIGNILDQYYMLEKYYIFLRVPDKSIAFANGVLYPYGKIDRHNKMVIYGRGRFGIALHTLLVDKEYCDVLAWTDSAELYDKKIEDVVWGNYFDKVVVAVLLYDVAREIFENLVKMGVDKEKIMLINL